ncbi:hypothetical protein LA080_012364 [Diaporthe eres]|nr:hypothetical protein LA080_012364 [Diaporthe eres]
MTFENSPQAHNAEIISDCDLLCDKIGQGENFAIPCSPAPDPVLFTSYGRCSLLIQCATKNNNEDNATIWSFIVLYIITAASRES